MDIILRSVPITLVLYQLISALEMTTLLIKNCQIFTQIQIRKTSRKHFCREIFPHFQLSQMSLSKKNSRQKRRSTPESPSATFRIHNAPYPASLRSSPTAHANRFHSKNHRNSSASTILRGLLRTSRLATTPPPVWPNFTPSPTRNSYFFRGIKSATGCASRKTTFHANLTAFRITFEGGIRFTGATFSPNF